MPERIEQAFQKQFLYGRIVEIRPQIHGSKERESNGSVKYKLLISETCYGKFRINGNLNRTDEDSRFFLQGLQLQILDDSTEIKLPLSFHLFVNKLLISTL